MTNTYMTKYSFGLILLFITCSCNNAEEKKAPVEKTSIDLEEISYPENYSKIEFIDSNGVKTVHIDSLLYEIRWKYHNESLKIKHVIDTLIKIDSFYTYSNDSLIGYGLRTYPNNASIGKWKVKTKNYEDSIIDHNEKWNCNYFDALIIAEENGFKLPNIEVSEGSYSPSSGLSYKWHIKKTDYPYPPNSDVPYSIVIDKRSCICYLYNKKNRQLFNEKVQKYNNSLKR